MTAGAAVIPAMIATLAMMNAKAADAIARRRPGVATTKMMIVLTGAIAVTVPVAVPVSSATGAVGRESAAHRRSAHKAAHVGVFHCAILSALMSAPAIPSAIRAALALAPHARCRRVATRAPSRA